MATACKQALDGRQAGSIEILCGVRCAKVNRETKTRLRAERKTLNPFALRREMDCQVKVLEEQRRVPDA